MECKLHSFYRLILFAPLLIQFSVSVKAQIVNIPDPNFKSSLINNPAINLNLDSEIQLSEASSYTGMIQVMGLNISDLTGLESFTNITGVNCTDNNLTSIDISVHSELQYLFCNRNNLSTLDVSNNANLIHLQCNNNQLTSINLNGAFELREIYCSHNLITAINFNGNAQVHTIFCFENPLSTLSINNCTELKELRCYNTSLTSIDISNCLKLFYLDAHNTGVTGFYLNDHEKLKYFDCHDCNLSSLYIANGNNPDFTYFNALDNNLSCIEVDDMMWSVFNWPHVDSSNLYNINCP